MGKIVTDWEKFFAKLKAKLLSFFSLVAGGFVLMAFIFAVIWLLSFLVPSHVREAVTSFLARLEDPQEAREYFLRLGAWKEFIFVLIQYAQVLIAPVPGQIPALVSGYIFGFWKGLALSMLGMTLGSWTAIYLARLLGGKVIRRFMPAGIMDKFDYLIDQGGYSTFFMIYLLPALPNDAICFISGLTKLRVLPLMLVCFLGRLPGTIILCFTGASLQAGYPTVALVIFGAAMLVSLVIWFFSDELEDLLRSKTRLLRNSGKKL